MPKIVIVPASSLEKVFLDKPPLSCEGISVLKGESFSCQFAFTADRTERNNWSNAAEVRFFIDSPIKDHLTVGLVEQVPVIMTSYPRWDQDYLRTEPGLFPDPVSPIEGDAVTAYFGKWRSLWVSFKGGVQIEAGSHPITLVMTDKDGCELARGTFTLRVIDAVLPEQTFPCTNWLHFDSIASAHHVAMFSEEFWALLEKYVRMAVEGGTNMLLTPCFTPPLDTPVGGERMTAQLVDVSLENGCYAFGFERLARFIKMALDNGCRYFEHAHLFTQWGSEHAPKIIAAVDGEEKRLFGWETDACGAEYSRFIDSYLSALVDFLKKEGVFERFFFHVSDEPTEKHIDAYRSCRNLLLKHIPEDRIFDALSDVRFLEQGIVTVPIAATNRIGDFLGKTDHLWAYYTGGQSFLLSNRLISMPQRRNRVMGLQLYRYNIKGFLHWGYNFYFNRLSRKPVDPWRSTDAMGDFVGGTSYLVYPGENGPVPSLRYYAFAEAMNDLRALQLLESLAGREETVRILEEAAGKVTFENCPAGDAHYLRVREAINRAIEEQRH